MPPRARWRRHASVAPLKATMPLCITPQMSVSQAVKPRPTSSIEVPTGIAGAVPWGVVLFVVMCPELGHGRPAGKVRHAAAGADPARLGVVACSHPWLLSFSGLSREPRGALAHSVEGVCALWLRTEQAARWMVATEGDHDKLERVILSHCHSRACPENPGVRLLVRLRGFARCRCGLSKPRAGWSPRRATMTRVEAHRSAPPYPIVILGLVPRTQGCACSFGLGGLRAVAAD